MARRRATAVGWRDRLESDPRRGRRRRRWRLREPQEALSAATIVLEISSPNARVAALQKRWDCLRAGLDLVLQQRGVEMVNVPGGASGLLCRDFKGRERRPRSIASTGVVSLVVELRGHEREVRMRSARVEGDTLHVASPQGDTRLHA